MSNKPSTERRRHPRASIVAHVRTTDPTEKPLDQVTDISESGMFIHTNKPYEAGSVLGVELHVPGVTGGHLFLKGRVVRKVEQTLESPLEGMAVEFESVPPRELSLLRRLISGSSGVTANILLLTEDLQLEKMIQALFVENRCQLLGARGWRDVSDMSRQRKADLIIYDLDSQDVKLDVVKAASGQLPVILVCKAKALDLQAQAAKLGIFEILEKPVGAEQLMLAVNRELQASKALKRAEATERPTLPTSNLVSRSNEMQEVLRQIGMLSQVSQPVLIIGETGVGKEVVARAIQNASPYNRRNMVVADCTLMDKNLMVSTLFGHEKGAFTGALNIHDGLVKQASDGILFLDEIGELSLECQAKLLRLLESGTYRRLGGNHDMISKARILAATNRDLRKMVQEGIFREDLLYRLQVHTIRIPPLRTRKEDILPLAYHLLEELNKECQTNVVSFSPEAVEQLTSYEWPGNVRELRNSIAASLLGIEGDQLPRLILQPSSIPGFSGAGTDPFPLSKLTWEEFSSYVEKQEHMFLQELLRRAAGNITNAATLAKMTRQNLSKKIKEHKIHPSDYKPTNE